MFRGVIRRGSVVAALCLASLAPFGCGSSGAEESADAEAAIERYRGYLEENSADLVTWIEELRSAVVKGHLRVAQSRYASSRVPYGHVEQVSESLGELDSRINARPGEVSAGQLSGYHEVEEALFAEHTVGGTLPTVERLLADVEELQRKVKTVDLEPEQLASGAQELLEEAAAVELSGKEQPNAHIDVADVAANVEGAEAVFKAVKLPLLAEDRELASAIGARLHDTLMRLRDFGVPARDEYQPRVESPGTSFVLYVERSPAEIAWLRRGVAALAALFAEVPDLSSR